MSRKLGYWFSRLMQLFFLWSPWPLNRGLAHVLTFLWFDLFRIRRRDMDRHILIAFPLMQPEERLRIARHSVWIMCLSFFDVLKIPSLNLRTDLVKKKPESNWINENVIFHGLEHIQTLNSGCFFMSLHMASGDLAAAIMSDKVRPLCLITKRLKNRFFDEFWFSLRRQSQTQFIDPHSGNNAYEILQALRQKRGVIFVVDQFMGRPYGLETEFFGRKTGTAYGLALFALKTKLPVFPLFTRWDKENRLHIHIEQSIDLRPFVDKDKEVAKIELTNYFNTVLETIISRFPDHWMWVHRRWKEYE